MANERKYNAFTPLRIAHGRDGAAPQHPEKKILLPHADENRPTLAPIQNNGPYTPSDISIDKGKNFVEIYDGTWRFQAYKRETGSIDATLYVNRVAVPLDHPDPLISNIKATLESICKAGTEISKDWADQILEILTPRPE
jgi:hypothetical protein